MHYRYISTCFANYSAVRVLHKHVLHHLFAIISLAMLLETARSVAREWWEDLLQLCHSFWIRSNTSGITPNPNERSLDPSLSYPRNKFPDATTNEDNPYTCIRTTKENVANGAPICYTAPIIAAHLAMFGLCPEQSTIAYQKPISRGLSSLQRTRSKHVWTAGRQTRVHI